VRGGAEFGGWTGTVVCLPPELGGPVECPTGLYGVLSLDGEKRHCVAPELLELGG